LVPHWVPALALVIESLQTMAPPEHVTVPLWHGLLEGTHGAPLVHGAHAPALQYMFGVLPQGDPFGWSPCAMHCGPDAHAICIF
jgi:hypothetical protein